MLPNKAIRWAERVLDGRVTSTTQLAGGLTSSCHRLQLSDGRIAVLRRWTSDRQHDVLEFSAAREATVLVLLEGKLCPVPLVLARDDHGRDCDVPALILSFMPGEQPTLQELGSLDLLALAKVLARVHDIAAPDALPAFAPWCWRHPLGVPIGTRAAESWQRILDAGIEADAAREQAGDALLHGDFHLGNTLWKGSRLSAVLDWPAASRGNPLADVARMAGYLDVLAPGFGGRFGRAYTAVTGRILTPWWEARELLDRLPEDPNEPLDLTMFDAQVASVAARL